MDHYETEAVVWPLAQQVLGMPANSVMSHRYREQAYLPFGASWPLSRPNYGTKRHAVIAEIFLAHHVCIPGYIRKASMDWGNAGPLLFASDVLAQAFQGSSLCWTDVE